MSRFAFASGAATVVAGLALAGCSAGPSKADAQKAIEAEFSRMFGAALQGIEIQDFVTPEESPDRSA